MYVGGHFTKVPPGTERARLAAFSASTGALLPWAPKVDQPVLAMVMAPDKSRLVIGGRFDVLNGVAIHGLAGVDATTGANTTWIDRPIPEISDTRYSYVTDLVADADTVYVSANGEGSFDGRVAVNPLDGRNRWVDHCQGATWSLALLGNVLYSGSHAHNCAKTAGRFPESYNGILPANKRYYRLLAQDARSSAPTIQHWFPTTNGGIQGKLGPRTMATDGRHLWVGGEFTTVNGAPQQALTRFRYHSVAPDVNRPRTPMAVRAGTSRPGQVTVHMTGTEDLDNARLTYQLIRDENASAPVYTVSSASKPWAYPQFTFVDTQVAPGSTHSYQLRAIDPYGNTSRRSALVTVTVASAARTYAPSVLADVPSAYFRLAEAPGTATAVNATGGGGGTYGSGVTLGQAGAVPSESGNRSASFNGTSTGVMRTGEKMAGPSHYSIEAWVRTRTTTGGKLVGFGNSNSTTGTSSTSYDRHVYMNNAGQVLFGAYRGTAVTIKTPASYNDGNWHHVVATMGAGGMKLYVDGTLRASGANTTSQPFEGWWSLGGDNLRGWPERPASDFLAGQLDDVSIYPFELTPAEAQWHWQVR